MSLTLPWRRAGKHDPAVVIDRLRTENQLLLAREIAASDFFTLLIEDRDQAIKGWQQEKQRADELAADRAELLELRAFKANILAINAPAGTRDIDPDDQPTHPQGIDVKPLWDALGQSAA